MTPSQLELAAREQYNAVGETFWSQAEILRLMYFGCMELATETLCIERTYSTTTVADQQEYSYPTNAIAPKRITYNGLPIDPIDLDMADQIDLNGSDVTAVGLPVGYTIWNDTIALHPTPSEAKTLKIYAYVEPQEITITSTLEVPTWAHPRLVNFIVAKMLMKDSRFVEAERFLGLWEKDKLEVRRWVKKRKRGNRFAAAKDEDSLPPSYAG